ncbi:nucleotidyl transferase AbiEii/AbiGii toxin family protein [soil metagenome]
MSKKSKELIKDMSASVHARLLNNARLDKRPFNELLQYFAMERFLYRLSKSTHAKLFVLKGAMMLRVWKASDIRPTMDIDLLGRTANEIQSIVDKVKEIIEVRVEPAGLSFDATSITGELITEDADYEGVRINFEGSLGNAKIPMQIDIGFGDIIYPDPTNTELPVMLDFPNPTLLCYSRESSIAEKLQAMIKLGEVNSRMKDFFDIWKLSRQFDFSGEIIAEAVRLTLKHRHTEIPNEIVAFSERFMEVKQIQWTAFHKRINQPSVPSSFKEIVNQIEIFITPISKAVTANSKPPSVWKAPGPWK